MVRSGRRTCRPPPELAGVGRSLGAPGAAGTGGPEAAAGGRTGARKLHGGIDAAGETRGGDRAPAGAEEAAVEGAVAAPGALAGCVCP